VTLALLSLLFLLTGFLLFTKALLLSFNLLLKLGSSLGCLLLCILAALLLLGVGGPLFAAGSVLLVTGSLGFLVFSPWAGGWLSLLGGRSFLGLVLSLWSAKALSGLFVGFRIRLFLLSLAERTFICTLKLMSIFAFLIVFFLVRLWSDGLAELFEVEHFVGVVV
jgi:hypothetical protein